MMGAGKSSVGRCLQKRTGLALFDMDEIVSAKFGSSISKIFETHGEEKFRDAGVEIIADPRPVPGTARFYVRDPGGNLFEIAQQR